MPITIGSNISALKVQRNLGRATDGISRSFERLSSGLRINRASDDPAGLAISSSLNVNSRILARAKLNINDASSLLNVANGGISEVSNLLLRMQELSEQAANGTLSRSQREHLNREYQQLDLEIRRITKTTTFNGLSPLAGERNSEAATLIYADDGTTSTAGLSLSSSGRHLLYLAPNQSLVARDLQTNTETTIVTGAQMSVTGGEVLNNGDVVYSGYNPLGVGQVNLFYYSRATGRTEQLTNSFSGSDIGSYDVSDDGSFIAFTSTTVYQNEGTKESASSSANNRLYVMNLETGRIRATTTNITAGVNALFISADGRYTGISYASNSGIYTFDRLSSSSTLNSFIASNTTRGITNQGSVLYTSNSNGFLNVFALDANTNTTKRITNWLAPGSYRASRVSTDGNILYYTSTINFGDNPSGARQLYALNLNNGQSEMLTNYRDASLIPNGSFQALSADGGVMISQSLTMDIYSTNLRQSAFNATFETGYGSTATIQTAVSSVFDAVHGLGAHIITSRGGALAALEELQANIGRLSAVTGSIGAAQSRLEYAHSLAGNQQAELSSASSRIIDADVAETAALLTQQQIVQRAAASLLAQANQQPALALQLLGGRR